MWIGVTKRFTRFHAALQLTQDQRDDGQAKQLGVRQSVQRAYWGPTTDTPPGWVVGSWGKGTAIGPPNDVDIFMPLPVDVYNRLQTNQGNIQSALLQEVKGHVETTYPQSTLRGDGQVVVVAFNTLTIEVVPVFNYDSAGLWVMPDSNGGGQWKIVRPSAEVATLDQADSLSNDNARRLIQVMKAWRDHCSVPLKSFLLEMVVAEFIASYAHREQSFFYYDWFVRDFLAHLISRRGGHILAPNSQKSVALGDAWLGKANTALKVAVDACSDEYLDYTISAGENWRKIFGDRIPVYVQ